MKELMFAQREPDSWEIQGVLRTTGLPVEDLLCDNLVLR